VNPGVENWRSLRQGNGNRFILYLYEPKSEPRISIYSHLALLPHQTGARLMYQMDKFTMKLGSAGESYIPAPGLFPGGGDRSAWFLEVSGGSRLRRREERCPFYEAPPRPGPEPSVMPRESGTTFTSGAFSRTAG